MPNIPICFQNTGIFVVRLKYIQIRSKYSGLAILWCYKLSGIAAKARRNYVESRKFFVFQYAAKTEKEVRNTITKKPSETHGYEVKDNYIDAVNLDYCDPKLLVDPKLFGKWVLKFEKGSHLLDDAWEKVIEGIKKGILWEAKVSPIKDEYDDQIICVYTPDFNNTDEIFEIYSYLTSDDDRIKIEDIAGYKTDEQTKKSSSEDIYLYSNEDAKERIVKEDTKLSSTGKRFNFFSWVGSTTSAPSSSFSLSAPTNFKQVDSALSQRKEALVIENRELLDSLNNPYPHDPGKNKNLDGKMSLLARSRELNNSVELCACQHLLEIEKLRSVLKSLNSFPYSFPREDIINLSNQLRELSHTIVDSFSYENLTKIHLPNVNEKLIMLIDHLIELGIEKKSCSETKLALKNAMELLKPVWQRQNNATHENHGRTLRM